MNASKLAKLSYASIMRHIQADFLGSTKHVTDRAAVAKVSAAFDKAVELLEKDKQNNGQANQATE